MAIAISSGAAPVRQEMVERYLPLVRAIASRFAHRGEELDDLVQAGAVGLIGAVDRYRPERGDFVPFAVATVSGEIRRHLRDRTPAVRLPRSLQELGGRLAVTEVGLAAALGRRPSTEELAAEAGAAPEAVAALRARPAVPAPLPADGELGADEDELAAAEDRLFLADSLRALGLRERRIVHLRYFEGLTQAEIARALGLSPAHVSRLLADALRTLRLRLGDPSGR